MTELTGKVGFASPVSKKPLSRRRILRVELFATVALAISLIVAVTTVSIGMARAQAFVSFGSSERTPFTVGLFFGAVMAGMGGLTAIVASDRQVPRD